MQYSFSGCCIFYEKYSVSLFDIINIVLSLLSDNDIEAEGRHFSSSRKPKPMIQELIDIAHMAVSLGMTEVTLTGPEKKIKMFKEEVAFKSFSDDKVQINTRNPNAYIIAGITIKLNEK